MTCPVCSFIQSDKVMTIYEDDEVIAFLNSTPAVPGEVLVTTKKHYTLLEEVPNHLVGKLFSLSNKISIALFELLGLKGTNILVNEGAVAGQEVQHFLIHLIPRKEGDNLNFDWPRKKPNPDEFETTYLLIKEFTDKIVITDDEPAEEKKPTHQDEKEASENKEEKSEEKAPKEDKKDFLNDKKKLEDKKPAGKGTKDNKHYKEIEVEDNYFARQLRRIP